MNFNKRICGTSHWQTPRWLCIGFDLRASDRKVSAVINGKLIKKRKK